MIKSNHHGAANTTKLKLNIWGVEKEERRKDLNSGVGGNTRREKRSKMGSLERDLDGNTEASTRKTRFLEMGRRPITIAMGLSFGIDVVVVVVVVIVVFVFGFVIVVFREP